ncbi:MAG: hypothetical protein N4S00_07825 [Lactobacillus crispatus]|nr:hypothetical protein [Lactobacillus crispatus]
MTLKVEVKHGMVTKFQPVSLGIGSISNLRFTKQAGKDIWTYQVHFKSLNQLKKQAQGSLRLSVPIANIHDRLFKVWFAFGVKNVAHSSTVSKALTEANSSTDSSSTSDAITAANDDSSKDAKNATSSAQPQSKPVKKQQASSNSSVKPSEKMATIAAVEYPFLPVIAGFLAFDAAIIGLAFYLRNKILKRKK